MVRIHGWGALQWGGCQQALVLKVVTHRDYLGQQETLVPVQELMEQALVHLLLLPPLLREDPENDEGIPTDDRLGALASNLVHFRDFRDYLDPWDSLVFPEVYLG